MDFKKVKIEIYIPAEYTSKLREALNNIGALGVGNYDNVMSVTKITGYWRPLEGASPFDWKVNEISEAPEDKVEFIDEILNNYNIDGVECMHNTFSEENINYLEKICNERGYYKSGGSDYHGNNKPNISLGTGKGNLKIPNEYIEEWI